MSPFANKRGRKPYDNSDGGLKNNYLTNFNCITNLFTFAICTSIFCRVDEMKSYIYETNRVQGQLRSVQLALKYVQTAHTVVEYIKTIAVSFISILRFKKKAD